MGSESVSEVVAAGIVGAGANLCSYCGDLSWTVRRYGFRVHKAECPHRPAADWSQSEPPPEVTR